mgnify:CR=1 FL=1
MRLEFNPRALCYNLYCDTAEEKEKLRQMMEEMTTNINALSDIIYVDTDSIKKMKTKLNSVYGKVVTDMTNKNYIVVHPTGSSEVAIIFKNKITAVFKHDDGSAEILLESGSMFYLNDGYATIISQLI